MTTRPFQLQSIDIGDEPAAWAGAGFTVDDGCVTIADTVVQLVGTGSGRGVRCATLAGLQADIDGMPFTGLAPRTPVPSRHPNHVVGFDHLVAMSPDLDRTTTRLMAAGLDHRRTRTFDARGTTMRQEFFWLGDVILELAGEDGGHGPGPAVLWGLALTCDDLDAAVADLGDVLGAPKAAVQKGRRIVTVRTRDLDISVPIALMSPHPTRTEDDHR